MALVVAQKFAHTFSAQFGIRLHRTAGLIQANYDISQIMITREAYHYPPCNIWPKRPHRLHMLESLPLPIQGKKKRLLLVDDHTILRAGMRALFSQAPELEVVGEADNGRDAIHAVGVLKPHVVLMDISMPGISGIEAIGEIRRRYPEVRMLVMTIYKTEEYIQASLKAGANGYILKDASPDELRLAIRTVLSGKTYLSPDISSQVISSYLGPTSGAKGGTSPWETLTARERQVLKLVAEGNANKYIADYLCLSIKTVEKHRSNVMKKLDLHNASALTAYAIEKGLVGR